MSTLFESKLLSSGLTVVDAEALGLEYIEDASTLHTSFWQVPALKIKYFSTIDEGFYRVRRLAAPVYGAKEGAPKYLQEPDSGVHAYFPRLAAADWPVLFEDTGKPLIITEGELKAAKCTKEGLPCIGLGGVNSYSNKKKGVRLIQDLEKIKWERRHVYVIYDSDIVVKKDVSDALNNFSQVLESCGAFVYTVILPQIAEKTGLDDFLINFPVDILKQLLKKAWPLSTSRSLWALNDRFCQVKKPSVILDKQTLIYYQFNDFKAGTYTPQQTTRTDIVKGELKVTEMNIARKWCEWPCHDVVDATTYAPGGPEYVYDYETGLVRYNTWKGWGVEPIKGDVKPFLALFDHVFTGASESFKKWVMQWFAYPLQNPGTKLYTALIVIGALQGTGKSFIGEIMGGVYGDTLPESGRLGYMHSTNLSDNMFKSAFNGVLGDKCFVRVEEVVGADTYADANRVKNMVTQQSILINRKGIEAESRLDRINYYITSNYIRAAKIETGDRRFAVHYVSASKAPDALYEKIDRWFRDPDKKGLSALLWYLLHKVDCSDFNPRAAAPDTAAKQEVIDSTMSHAEAWIRQVMENPILLSFGSTECPDLMTASEVLAAFNYSQGTPSKYTSNRMGAILKDCGVPKAHKGYNISIGGVRTSYYIMKNLDRWCDASYDECREYLERIHRDDKRNF